MDNFREQVMAEETAHLAEVQGIIQEQLAAAERRLDAGKQNVLTQNRFFL